MSGIAVIFNRGGAPVAPDQLKAMTDAMATRKVDGVRHVIEGPIGIGFCSMATTPEAVIEQQPFRQGPLLIAFDGRLDDRRSLLAALGPAARKGAGDAELVAAAVERWGDGFVNHIIGDFAIVVADLNRRRLLCARDHLGVKPLYYASCGDVFVAASEVRAVLAHPAVPGELDPDAFAAYAQHWMVPEGTIYRAIARVPMATTMAVSLTGVASPARFWTPSCVPDGGRTPDDLIEEYRWLLGEAVRDRLRAVGPVVVSMSGGLDSTSVASVALAVTRDQPGLAEVRLGSAVYPDYPRIDESAQIDVMERFLGISVNRVRTRPRSPDDLAAEVDDYRELPDVPNDIFSSLMCSERSERIMLTGLGGDDWFYAPQGLALTIALRHGRLPTALKAVRRLRTEGPYPTLRRAAWRAGFRPLLRLPRTAAARSLPLRALLYRMGGRPAAAAQRASWRLPGMPLDTEPILHWCTSPLLGSQLAALERRASNCGFDQRHPLHDVRLVELSLRLPGRQRTLDGDSRWLPRRAMAGGLPDPVRLRRDKAEFSLTVREELETAWATGGLERALAQSASPDSRRAEWLEIQATPWDLWHPRLFALWSVLALHVGKERAL